MKFRNKIKKYGSFLILSVVLLCATSSFAQIDDIKFRDNTNDQVPISSLLGFGLAVGAVIGYKKLFGKKGLKED
jgi:hypothetical protein